jgi:hypothetical protein
MSTTKVSPIRAVMGFGAMVANNLVAFAKGVLAGLTGNASFANPTVSLTTFGNDITTYSNAITAALDGGKNAKAAEDNLTSGTLYAFQVQALGIQGLSAWSDSSTIMCP